MNKNEFIEKLLKELNYSKEQCVLINNILESNFVISKKSRDSIIDELVNQLEISKEEANRIYDISVKVIKEEVKNQLKHPFRSKDS